MCFGWGFSLPQILFNQKSENFLEKLAPALITGAVLLPLGSYFLWIFRISWRQLSPRGVLHLTGILAVIAIGLPSTIVQNALEVAAIPFPELRFHLHHSFGWSAFGGTLNLIWFLIVLAKYQSVAALICRMLGLPKSA